MKIKYFNVLTENEKQKTAIADYIGCFKEKDEEISEYKLQTLSI